MKAVKVMKLDQIVSNESSEIHPQELPRQKKEQMEAGSSGLFHGLTRSRTCSASASLCTHVKWRHSGFLSYVAKVMQLVCVHVRMTKQKSLHHEGMKSRK